MAEERSLPGWPKKKLVRDVRRHLSHYGIRPTRFTIWQATWAWASAIANSYVYTHWPMPSEIGAQYILLLLTEMQQSHQLRLPFRAKTVVPAEVRALLPTPQQPALVAITGKIGEPEDTTDVIVQPTDTKSRNHPAPQESD